MEDEMFLNRYQVIVVVSILALSLVAAGCGKKEEPVAPTYPQGYQQPMYPQQPGVAQPGQPVQPGVPVQPAAPMQPAQPVQPVQPVQPANPMNMLGQMMGAQPAQPGGVATFPWQSLSQALPVSTPGWAMNGQVEGESANIMGMYVSKASCKLKQGNMNAEVEIVDTSMNPMIAMPFNMMRTVQIDSSKERVGPITYGVNPATQKFDKRRNEAQVIVMVSNRIMVTITVKNAPSEAVASGIGQYVNYAHLAKLVGG